MPERSRGDQQPEDVESKAAPVEETQAEPTEAEIHEQHRQEIFDAYLRNSPKSATELAKQFKISSRERNEIARHAIFEFLQRGKTYNAYELMGNQKLKEDFLKTPEAQEAARKGLEVAISERRPEAVRQLIEGGDLPEEWVKTEYLQELVRHTMLLTLINGGCRSYLAFEEMFDISKDYRQNKFVRLAAAQGAKLRTSTNNMEVVEDLIRTFELPADLDIVNEKQKES